MGTRERENKMRGDWRRRSQSFLVFPFAHHFVASSSRTECLEQASRGIKGYTVNALWADTLVSGQLLAPVADTFSAARFCPLTRASTIKGYNSSDCLLTGGREVEVIGTPERVPEAANHKGKTPPDHRVSCRGLGEADHEGWLAKKGKHYWLSRCGRMLIIY